MALPDPARGKGSCLISDDELSALLEQCSAAMKPAPVSNTATSETPWNAAEAYAARGWVPLALRGKIPIARGWTEISVATWQARWVNGTTNVGIRTGPESALLVVDVDVKDGGLELWTELLTRHEEPRTVRVRTGSGGLHYYFAWDARAATLKSASKLLRHADGTPAGVDVKAAGGQVVAPPSKHPETGKEYQYEVTPEEIGMLPPLPDWLYEALRGGAKTPQPRQYIKPAGVRDQDLLDMVYPETQATPARAPMDAAPFTVELPIEAAFEATPAKASPLEGPPPQYGETVTVDGEAREVDLSLIAEVLAKVPCPGEATAWGGLLQNVKSLVREGAARQHADALYEAFDAWSRTGAGYDEAGNALNWYRSRGTGDFRTLIGMAVRNGLRRKPPPTPSVPPINDSTSRFYLRDLLALRHVPREESELREATKKCIAHVARAKGLWITKAKGPSGETQYDITSSLSDLSGYRFQVIGQKKPQPLPKILERFFDDIDCGGVDFLPYPPTSPPVATEYFNLFTGFVAPVEPMPELAGPLLAHIRDVWCRGEQALVDYVLNWFAYLVQFPAKKPGTVLVLRSDQGAGKNMVTDFIGNKVFGPELFLSTTDLEKVLGRFNGAIQGRKLIVLNEVGMSGVEWHKANDRLKGLITEPTVVIEKKGLEPVQLHDYAAYMILSNHDSPVRVESSDRRMVCLDVSTARAGDLDYFEGLAASLEDSRTAGAVMAVLMSRNLTDWRPAATPDTEMKQALRREHLPSPVRFILESYEDWADQPAEIPCEQLYRQYATWCCNQGEKQIFANQHFGQMVRTHCGLEKKRIRADGARLYVYVLNREVACSRLRKYELSQ